MVSAQAPLILPWRGVSPTIAASAFVAPGATVIGDIDIGEEASLWFQVVARADVNHIRIGARSNVQDGTVIHVTSVRHPTIIGAGVTIGHGAILHGCILEDGCFVGMDATVMDGTVVEGGAMIAAGALVTPGKRVPAGELWAGRPAQCKRPMTEAEMSEIAASAERYAKLARDYRTMLGAGPAG